MFTPLFRLSDPRHDLDQLHRTFDALFSGLARAQRVAPSKGPAFDVFDEAEAYRLVADLPGLRAEDLELEATDDGLTIRGHRKVEAPEGFSVHRREREDLRFSRSFTFPTKVDPDQVEATLDKGVLTVSLAKRADAKPRSITVRGLA